MIVSWGRSWKQALAGDRGDGMIPTDALAHDEARGLGIAELLALVHLSEIAEVIALPSIRAQRAAYRQACSTTTWAALPR